jgi:hypothetical protein
MNLSEVRVLSTNSSGGSGIGVSGSTINSFMYSCARKNCGNKHVITAERAVKESKPKKTK